MALIAKESGGTEFEAVPIGTHRAICYKLADAGTREEKFKEEEPKKRHTVFIFWELPDLRTSKDQPFSIFKQYTMSLNENSALHKDLKSWRGKSFSEEELKAFDLTNILGVSCVLEVEHTSGGKAKVASVFKPDGGAKKLPTANDPVVFDLEDYCKEFSDESNDASKEMCDVFADLPNFLCDIIDQSYEIAAAHAKSRKAEAPKGLAAMAKMQQEAQPAKDQPAEEFHDDEIPF